MFTLKNLARKGLTNYYLYAGLCLLFSFSRDFKRNWLNLLLKFINPLRAKFIREDINIYFHFMSFLHTNKTHAVEIPPWVRQGPAYST